MAHFTFSKNLKNQNTCSVTIFKVFSTLFSAFSTYFLRYFAFQKYIKKVRPSLYFPCIEIASKETSQNVTVFLCIEIELIIKRQNNF